MVHGRYVATIPALALIALLWAGCSPVGGDESAPPALAVEPLVLEFPAGFETDSLIIKNSGGEPLSFSLSVVAQSSGVSWLQVQPEGGAIEPGGAKAIVVRVQNRDELGPGDYSGKIVVDAEGLESVTVDISMAVGQPILLCDPDDEIDFGEESGIKSLVIRNDGEGELIYSVALPGPWLTTKADLQKSIGPNEPETVTLNLDRALAPWYGDGSGEIVVSSNGKEGAGSGPVATIMVRFVVDDQCSEDEPCTKAGYYCFAEGASKSCRKQAEAGEECATEAECASGMCAAGICCNQACEGPCVSCSLPTSPGLCSPLPAGTPCDDGLFCTADDSCKSGVCEPGPERDCTDSDTTCGFGMCDEETGACRPDIPDDKCGIDGQCYDDGEWHPVLECLRCDPAASIAAWTLIDGVCLLDGECYAVGKALPGECKVCNPALPYDSSPAPDLTPCTADAKECTEDVCMGGECEHLAMTTGICDDGNLCTSGDQCVDGKCEGEFYTCDDGLDCTEDICLGNSDCEAVPKDGFCLIDGQCYAADEASTAAFGCALCKPATSQSSWTIMPLGTSCDDEDACTDLDHCVEGVCTGKPVDCSDGLNCTADNCNSETGDCSHMRDEEWCIIGGKCYGQETSPSGPDAQCKVCAPLTAPEEWSAHNQGLACDDLSACSATSQCEAGVCTAVGPLCDDGNECTDNICADDSTCENPSLDDGVACATDDVDCTDDVCMEGECAHPISDGSCRIDDTCRAALELNPDDPCTVCAPEVAQDTWTAGNAGGECDDQFFCTVDDACDAGICAGIARVCGSDDCNTGECDEELDACYLVPVLEGTVCEDLDPCTVADECAEGVCAGKPKDCSAATLGNPCLDPLCNPDSLPDAGACEAIPADPGEPCDDGLACTTETTCAEGQCGGGHEVTPQSCKEAFENTNPCVAGLCVEPGGCLLDNMADETECTLPGADAECHDGACAIVSCLDGLKDCNENAQDGCEADVLTDADNCGECLHECNDDQATVECSDGACAIVACTDGFGDCDLDAATGCETPLAVDAANCGECGKVCAASSPGKIGSCDNQACTEEDCPADTYNLDGDTANGCEAENVIWVDASNAGDADGTYDHPYPTIGEGVDAADAQDFVYVLGGVYNEGGIEVDENDVTVVGEDRDGVLVLMLPGQTGILVTADNVTIRTMTLTGGRVGIEFAGSQWGEVVGGLATDLSILDLASAGIPGEDGGDAESAAGVDVSLSSGVVISEVLISGVTGGKGGDEDSGGEPAGAGGLAAAVRLSATTGCTIKECTISEVTGGEGGKGAEHSGYVPIPGVAGLGAGVVVEESSTVQANENLISNVGGGAGGSGGGSRSAETGGIGAAFYLSHADGGSYTNNEASGIAGGSGGPHPGGNGSSGLGGIGAGFYLDNCESNVFAENVLSQVDGGTGGTHASEKSIGADQAGFGFYFGSNSADNSVELSNTVDGDPVVYVCGLDGLILQDLELEAESNPTNVGKIVVRESSNIKILDCVVSHFQGEAGKTGVGDQGWGLGGKSGYGIYVNACTDCEVSGNEVSAISGGTGGTGAGGRAGGSGGSSYGVILSGCSQSVVADNRVGPLAGGTGGQAGKQLISCGCGGNGAEAVGIALTSCVDTVVHGNEIRGLSGGAGGDYDYYEDAFGAGGEAWAYYVKSHIGDFEFSNNLAATISRGTGNDGYRATCFLSRNQKAMTLRNFTCHNVLVAGDGIVAHDEQVGIVKLLDSIVSNVAGFCLSNQGDNPQVYLTADYSALWQCGAGEADNATVKNACLSEDPGFVNAPAGNLHLSPDSSCVDTGDPDSGCGEEPVPNGCQVNMGAYGGTSEATSAPGADNCDSCGG